MLDDGHVGQLVQSNGDRLVLVEEHLHLALLVGVGVACLTDTVDFYLELVVKLVYFEDVLFAWLEEPTMTFLAIPRGSQIEKMVVLKATNDL